MILAMDTSTSCASIALFEKHLLAERSWVADQNHTTQLPVEIERMMLLLKITPQHLTAVVVATGPGSFNGLRVGLAEAKGLSFSLAIPLVGISTLEAMAYEYADVHMPIRPVLSAGRGEVNTALYEMKEGKWLELEQPWIASEDNLLQRLDHPTFFCGDVHQDIILRVARKSGSMVRTPVAKSFRHAGFLAQLGARRLRRGDFDDPVTLQPIYLRRPGITKSTRHDALAVAPIREQEDEKK